MKLIETETVDAIIARMRSFLPVSMHDSVLHYLDKPEELTKDVIKAVHPQGLYLVQYIESPEAESEETLVFGVHTVAIGLLQSNKLGRAAKLIVPGLAPFGGHQLRLNDDKPQQEEGEVMIRCVSFRMNHPTLPLSDTKINAKIAELEL